MSFVLTSLYSVIPAVFCFYYYIQEAQVLLKRHKKIGRNLNLVMCFATICFIWIFCLGSKIFVKTFNWMVNETSESLFDRSGYAFFQNYGRQEVIILLGSLTSIIDPVLILICQKDYREPFTTRLKKLAKKLGKWKWNIIWEVRLQMYHKRG